jgi:hemoglobin
VSAGMTSSRRRVTARSIDDGSMTIVVERAYIISPRASRATSGQCSACSPSESSCRAFVRTQVGKFPWLRRSEWRLAKIGRRATTTEADPILSNHEIGAMDIAKDPRMAIPVPPRLKHDPYGTVRRGNVSRRRGTAQSWVIASNNGIQIFTKILALARGTWASEATHRYGIIVAVNVPAARMPIQQTVTRRTRTQRRYPPGCSGLAGVCPDHDQGESTVVDTVTSAESSPTKSMFERVGGAPAVKALVDAFYEKVWADAQLARYFEGVDRAQLKGHQAKLITSVLGGPAYTGRDLGEAHSHLGVTGADYDKVVAHLVAACNQLEVPADIIGAVGEVLGQVKPSIVSEVTR